MSSVPSNSVRGQRREVVGAAHDVIEVIDRPGPPSRTWPRSAGPARRADCAAHACSRSPRRACAAPPPRLEQVAAVLGEDLARADRIDRVPGAPDALQTARHRGWRLDLHDQVDGAHVNAQLERAGRHQAAQRAALSASRPNRRCSREIEPWCARTSGGAPGSASTSASSFRRCASRSARRRLLTKISVERWPRISSSRRDRSTARSTFFASGGQTAAAARGSTWSGCSISRAARSPAGPCVCAGHVDQRHRPVDPPPGTADLVHRALRGPTSPMRCNGPSTTCSIARARAPGARRAWCRRTDGSRRRSPSDALEDLFGARGEQQIERLGRGIRMSGGVARNIAPIGRARIAVRRATVISGGGSPPRCAARPCLQWRFQVALDVVRERLFNGETYSTRQRRFGSLGFGSVASHPDTIETRQRLTRAGWGRMSVCWPAAIACQPCVCGGVGAANVLENHRAWGH